MQKMGGRYPFFSLPPPYNERTIETKIEIGEIKTGFAQRVSDKLKIKLKGGKK